MEDISMARPTVQENDQTRTDAGFPPPRHEEWLIDEAIRGSFPASDPASTSQPGSIAHVRYAGSS